MNDLWADLDSRTVGQGRARRSRRLNEQTIISTLRTWLLQDYAAAYCRSLAATRIFRRCYWIDALGIERQNEAPAAQENGTQSAGKRRRANARETIPQALLPVAALSQQLAEADKPITLRGLLLSGGSSRRKATRPAHHEQSLVLPKESGLVQASWLEAGPLLLKELEQSPAIFLLNPFGASTFTGEDLAPLCQRTVPTELCLLIPHRQIALLLQTARKAKQEERRQAVATLLTSLLRSDRWKRLPEREEEEQQAVSGWLDLFCTALRRHFPFPVQRIALPFVAGSAHVENAPYSLLFATRRQDSLVSMNDAVYHYHERVHAESRSGVLSERWFAAQEQERHEQKLHQLQQHVLQQGRTLRIRRWPDLRQQLLLTQFGQFTLRDYDMLIQQLLRDGEVRCEWRQRAVENDIPGNDDTLFWR